MLLHITVLLFLYQSDAFFTSYMFETSFTSSYFNVKYLLKNLEFGSAFRQGGSTGIVEKLPAEWNNNRTFESGYMFAWMKWFETPFEESVKVSSTIPANFGVGCHIDVVVQTPDEVLDMYFINIEDRDANKLFIHMSVRPDSQFTVLNTMIDGNWSDEYHVKVPAHDVTKVPNTLYTVAFYLSETQWDVYIDGVFLSNYTHVYTFSGVGEVDFNSPGIYCKRIMFFGPP